MQKKLKSTVIEFRNVSQQVNQETQQDVNSYKKLANHPTQNYSSLTYIKNRILNGVREINQNNPNNKLSSLTIGFPGPVNPIYIAESHELR